VVYESARIATAAITSSSVKARLLLRMHHLHGVCERFHLDAHQALPVGV
jgi:hypothetical protein